MRTATRRTPARRPRPARGVRRRGDRPRPRPARRRRRGGRAARAERRGQDHDPAHGVGAAARRSRVRSPCSATSLRPRARRPGRGPEPDARGATRRRARSRGPRAVLRAHRARAPPARDPSAATTPTVDSVLDTMPHLRDVIDRRAGRMSGGEQQMLAIARALVARPRLLMVDELSLGLAPIVVQQLLPLAALGRARPRDRRAARRAVRGRRARRSPTAPTCCSTVGSRSPATPRRCGPTRAGSPGATSGGARSADRPAATDPPAGC